MIKSFVAGIALLLAAVLLSACGHEEDAPRESILPAHRYFEEDAMGASRDRLAAFVAGRLTGEHGIYTNVQDSGQSADTATGHESLSESSGLLLRYYALTGQRAAFDAEWERAKATFDMKTGFGYRYSPAQSKLYRLNAAVDDLRIIRALREAETLFGGGAYGREAEAYGRRFAAYNTADGYLYDFYDETYGVRNDFVTLCYIDLRTLELLPLPQAEKKRLLANMRRIIGGGYLGDAFPFYETRYDYAAQSYASTDISTVESMLTILALAETGGQRAASIRFIKDQVKAGTLYGRYTREGKPATATRSTAIYAIAAMIGSELGDKELYDASIRRMNEFQVADSDSPLYGGFGDPDTGAAYSFDNLTALLAYAY